MQSPSHQRSAPCFCCWFLSSYCLHYLLDAADFTLNDFFFLLFLLFLLFTVLTKSSVYFYVWYICGHIHLVHFLKWHYWSLNCYLCLYKSLETQFKLIWSTGRAECVSCTSRFPGQRPACMDLCWFKSFNSGQRGGCSAGSLLRSKHGHMGVGAQNILSDLVCSPLPVFLLNL